MVKTVSLTLFSFLGQPPPFVTSTKIRKERLDNGASVGCNSGPDISTLLGDRASDSRSLHLALVVDNNTSVVLEVEEGAILPAPGLSLPDDDGWVHLLSQLWLSFSDGGKNHVTKARGREAVETALGSAHRDDVQVLGSGVVCAVHSSCDRETCEPRNVYTRACVQNDNV